MSQASHPRGQKGHNKWALDFLETKRKGDRGSRELSNPPGFMAHPPKEDESTGSGDSNLVAKMGWSIALGPWKQLPLNLLVLWMAGNTISLFPIMMVGMMFVRPVQTLFSYKDVFDRLRGDQAVLQKVVFILANLVGIALAVYKFNSMGLLPTSQSDWLEFMEARENLELSGGGFTL